MKANSGQEVQLLYQWLVFRGKYTRLYEAEKDNLGLANALMSLGDWHLVQHQFQQALTEYKKAIPLYQQEQESAGLAYCLADSIRCLKQIQNLDAK